MRLGEPAVRVHRFHHVDQRGVMLSKGRLRATGKLQCGGQIRLKRVGLKRRQGSNQRNGFERRGEGGIERAEIALRAAQFDERSGAFGVEGDVMSGSGFGGFAHDEVGCATVSSKRSGDQVVDMILVSGKVAFERCRV